MINLNLLVHDMINLLYYNTHLETFKFLDECGGECSEYKEGRLKRSVVPNHVFDLNERALRSFEI